MLILVAIALIGGAVSEPQSILPIGYNIVAPSVFPSPYAAIPEASIPAIMPASMPASIPAIIPAAMQAPIPAGIPAIIPAPMQAPIPAGIPASISAPIPAENIPAPALPLSSFPAATVPLTSIPAASMPAASIPPVPSVIQMSPSIIYPSLDINMLRPTVSPPPAEIAPEANKVKDSEMKNQEPEGVNPDTTTSSRKKRNVQRVLPYGYNLPYAGYETPYGHFASAPVPSSQVLNSNVLPSPYFSHF